MKCKHCNGLGRTKATEFVGVDEGLRDVVILCPTCGGKGEIELTEQEYIQTCNTEQLAESLLNIMANNEFTLYLLHTEKKSVQELKDAVVEWLKQPHQEE